MSDVIDRQIERLAGRKAGYAFALLVTAAAALIRWALDPLLHDTSQYMLFYFSVMVVALVAGMGPGALAILLGAVTGTGYFVLVGHLGSSWTDDLSRLTLFVLFGGLATALTRRLHEARDRAANTADKLRRTTEQVRLQAAALAAAPNAISLSKTDPDGTIVWVNPAFTELTGYRPEEAIGHSHHILSSGQQDEPFYRELWETIRRGEMWRGELVNRRKDGTLYHEEMGITPLRDEQGNITHYLAVKQDITARKRTEQALRESEQKFRIAAESARAAIGIIQGRRFVYANPYLTEISGYSLQEILSMDFLELVHPDFRAMIADYARRRQLGDPSLPSHYEFQMITKAGETRWMDFSPGTIEYNGRPAIIGSAFDVTARKRAEETLRASDERFRIAASVSRTMVFDVDLISGLPIFVGGMHELLGFDLDEVVPTLDWWRSRIHPDDLPAYDAEFDDAIARAVAYHGEYRVRRKQGDYIFVEDASAMICDASGRAVRTVGGIRDITDRKRTEQALRDSELFFRQTLESIPGMVFTTRPDGYCDYQSQQWVEFTGVPMSEHLGDGWNKLLHPDDRPRAYAAWRDAVEGRAPYDLEYRVRRHDGQYRWFKVRAQPIHDAEGRTVRWFGVCLDIEELKRTEEALAAATSSAERAKAAAEQASRAKDHFLAVLSHELRTPLAPVVTALSMLRDDRRCDADVRETLEMVRRNVELEARLIDDLLDITRIARGKVELQKKPVLLCEVIRRAVEVCKPDIEARRLHFGVDFGSDAPYLVHADIARLQQVFWNLLRNAIKFTPHGGCIGIRCRLENPLAPASTAVPSGNHQSATGNHQPLQPHVVAEVADSGIGIEPEDLARIFNAFEQAERSITRQFGGLGLGLAIARAIVELHGGTIEAHSDGRNKGATFRIRLPILAGATPPAPDAGQPPVAAATPSTRPLRILLVEDHGDTARTMQRLLTMDGHEVTMAADVAAALEEAGKRSFDLLLSDLGLPDASGLDLIRQLRARGHSLPAIALSGYGQEQDIRRSKEAGFATHLTKPTSPERLAEAIALATRASTPRVD